jgi:hypothetical protein
LKKKKRRGETNTNTKQGTNQFTVSVSTPPWLLIRHHKLTSTGANLADESPLHATKLEEQKPMVYNPSRLHGPKSLSRTKGYTGSECNYDFFHIDHNYTMPKDKSAMRYTKTPQLSSSQSTINLINNSPPRKLTPIPTTLRHHPRNLHFLDILRSFQNTNVQPSRHMPSNMAMKRPHAWVVLVDLQYHIGGCVCVFGGLDPDCVAALGVGRVGDCVVVFAEAFCEDVPMIVVLVETCEMG